MKTIEELISALESGEYAKSTGHFRDADGYCCLGVYATINEMWFPFGQGIFVWDDEPWDMNNIFAGPKRAQIPGDHWLAQQIHITESSFLAGGYDVQLQSYLTDVNDDSEEDDGFTHVVRALKAYAAGQRAFPSTLVFIDEVAV